MPHRRRFLRRTVKTVVFFIGWLVLFYLWDRPVPAAASDLKFELTFDSSIHAEPYSGRVYLFFSRRDQPEPRFGPNWFHPEPFLSVQVEEWKPGETLTISKNNQRGLRTYPAKFDDLSLDGHHVQAVVRFNPHDREVGRGVGNGFSNVAAVGAKTIALRVDQQVEPAQFPESRWGKELVVPSPLLSRFHNRDVSLKAAVILPASYYDQPQRRYPVIYNIPGFGGTHLIGRMTNPIREQNRNGVEFIRVTLDPSCPRGHHVFADSANNGPVGQALVEEFLPELDRQYRTIGKPAARFLTGHSSGGWSSLWLQITYPEVFGGVWSTAPDPVDFRDYQQVNLYRPGENIYVDANGNSRPLARLRGQPVLWYRGFAEMEWALDYGGQLHSFEAVFSPRGEDGTPLLLFDRQTGAIDIEVARTWEKYDIRLILEKNWSDLGPKLAGKLHVYMGDKDTFYLDGATVLLGQSLKQLGSDAVVEIFPGKNHSSLMTPELRARMRREMVDAFLAAFPEGLPTE